MSQTATIPYKLSPTASNSRSPQQQMMAISNSDPNITPVTDLKPTSPMQPSSRASHTQLENNCPHLSNTTNP